MAKGRIERRKSCRSHCPRSLDSDFAQQLLITHHSSGTAGGVARE
jgi:hypothetical protein